MINIPMRSTTPLDKDTILSVNSRYVQDAVTARNVISLNDRHKNPPSGRMAAQTQAPPASHAAPTRTTPAPYAAQTRTSPAPHTAPAAQRAPSVPAAPPVADRPVPALLNPLRKGQKVSLKPDGNPSRIQARLGWNITNAQCDTDVSAFLLNNSGKVIGDSWFVFYGQDTSPDGSTRFLEAPDTDREIISVDFTKLNPAVSKIVFVLTIYEALEKHLNFSMLKDAYIRIVDPASRRELASFMITDYYSNITSMMIGEVYKHNGIWKFNAVGNGLARDLAGLCEFYGVQVI